ncbi:MAG: GerW family sporulation protein [Oscillospiraceae bacterium]|nr:GerW family sporulation protein [Oscillospiraceae bacterium]MDD7294897.1 GerW family sporulation protein [Oscillospiraceae bacterium]MDY2509957.1 GerW family sporulation protein [Ruminococcus callidus]
MQETNNNRQEHTIHNLMGVSMDKIREMVDVQTIIGDPILVGTEITIIPISKVSYGFASGGSDLPAKVPKDLFGGGTGAGVSIQPVAFLVVQNGDVRLLQMTEGGDTANNLIRTLPEVVNKVTDMVKSKKESKQTTATEE